MGFLFYSDSYKILLWGFTYMLLCKVFLKPSRNIAKTIVKWTPFCIPTCLTMEFTEILKLHPNGLEAESAGRTGLCNLLLLRHPPWNPIFPFKYINPHVGLYNDWSGLVQPLRHHKKLTPLNWSVFDDTTFIKEGFNLKMAVSLKNKNQQELPLVTPRPFN